MTVAFPPKVRAVIYWAAFVIGLGLGATQVGYSAADAGQPTWLTVALAVFAFLAAGLGITAATNTTVSTRGHGPDTAP